MKKRGLRKTFIGKIQIIIGIILLVGSISGLIINYNWQKNTFNKNFEDLYDDIKEIENVTYSNETKYLGVISIVNYYSMKDIQSNQMAFNVKLAGGLAIILSIIFITQGLLNFKGYENNG